MNSNISNNELQQLIVEVYKEQIAFQLGMVSTQPALNALASHLSSENPDVYQQIVDTLVDIGSDDAFGLLENHFRTSPSEAADSLPLETPGCPSLARLYQLVLNPKLKDSEERRHLSTLCPHCEKRARYYESEIIHPTLSNLIAWKLGLLFEAQASFVEQHIARDQCLQCTNLLRAFSARKWLEELAQAAGQARDKAVDWIKQRAGNYTLAAHNVRLPLAAHSGAYADTKPPSLHLEFTDDPKNLTVTLRENTTLTRSAIKGDLIVRVVAAKEYAGNRVRVELIGDEIVSETMELRAGEKESVGTHNFGPLPAITRRLGENITAVAGFVYDE